MELDATDPAKSRRSAWHLLEAGDPAAEVPGTC